MLVQNFESFQQKKLGAKNMQKFGLILDDFKLWWRIAPERMKIFKIGQVLDLQPFLPRLTKKVQ